jgi:hypothetical protein
VLPPFAGSITDRPDYLDHNLGQTGTERLSQDGVEFVHLHRGPLARESREPEEICQSLLLMSIEGSDLHSADRTA